MVIGIFFWIGRRGGDLHQPTLPETNISPENRWLEDDPFLLGFGLFLVALAASFREGTVHSKICRLARVGWLHVSFVLLISAGTRWAF